MSTSQTIPIDPARRILVVQPDSSLRGVLQNFLARYFVVEATASPDAAMQALETRPAFHLVLAEMLMSPVTGIQLAEAIRARRPEVPLAFLTTARVEDHFAAIHRLGVTTVIVRSAPFDYDDFLVAVENLLFPERAFGLVRYFHQPCETHKRRVTNTGDRHLAVEDTIEFFRKFRRYETDLNGMRLALEELINNSIFHSFRRPDGTEKYRVGAFVRLEDHEVVEIEYGRDPRQLGFSVTDNQGTLDVGTVMTKLDRQISMEGLYDLSGRGLYLTRNLCDRMVINLNPGKSGQAVLLFHHRPAHQPKPLHINVVTGK